MKKNIIFATLLCLMIFGNTGCKDYYQDLNQDPANVTKVDPAGLMAEAILKFQPYDYLIWFYNIDYTCRWTQMGMPKGKYAEFTNDYTSMSESGGQGSQYVEMLRYRNDIRRYITSSKDTNYRAYEAVCTLLSIYLGIADIDMYGDIPYKQACMYEEGILTPEYDSVSDLYDLFLNQIDTCIMVFKNDKNYLKGNGAQDVVYNGDLAKWAKMANSLRMKIAVRLYCNEPDRAKSIAEDIAKSETGYIDKSSDDMLFCKTTKASNEDYVYGTGNGLAQIGLTRNVHKFLLNSKDPRIRFIYTKNSLNSKVIQGLLDSNKFDILPPEIRELVEVSAEKKFVRWKGLGEPWVRYQSVPVVLNIHDDTTQAKYYYNATSRYTVKLGGVAKEYCPFSYQTDEMKKGRNTYTLPTVGENVIEDKENHPLYCMYLTAAEMNLYFAEFAMLGASLPKSAEEYYNNGVRMSVETYDRLAYLNQIPYYGTTYKYDDFEMPIELQKDEIDTMMTTANVRFTGTDAEKFEKIYLQQLIHFSLMTNDQFVTSRRSGYPKIGSALLPMEAFKGIAQESIPRRFEITPPQVTDQMYENKVAAYERQGLTPGTGQSGSQSPATTVLNTERLWQDKQGPQWGSGK